VVAEVEASVNPYSVFRYWDVLLRVYWPMAVLRYVCLLSGHVLRCEEDKPLCVELGHEINKETIRIRFHGPMKCTGYSELGGQQYWSLDFRRLACGNWSQVALHVE